MQIVFRKAARKSLSKMPKSAALRIIDAIEGYGRDRTGDVKRLVGSEYFRLRVGTWRVLFEHEGETLMIVLAIGPRGDVYKKGRGL